MKEEYRANGVHVAADTVNGVYNDHPIFGSARDASLDGVEFQVVPHRTDDSKDDAGSWVWKLETWVFDENGDRQLLNTRLI